MSKARERVNRAIRAQCPGGDTVLDSLNLWHKIRQRKEVDGSPEELRLAQLAEEQLHEVRDAMAEHVNEQYRRAKQ